jgi:PPP family 3-phenylpropionic acid transporter
MELILKRSSRAVKWNFNLFYFFTFFGFGSLFPLLSVYLQKEVGLTGTQIGTIMSISPVVTILFQPIWGMISDYTQKPRLVLTVTLVSTGIIGFFYSFVEAYVWFLVIAALLAVTQSAIVPLSDSIALNYVQKEKENYGSIRLWGAIGFAVSVLIVGRLSELFHLSMIFYTFAIILLTAAYFAWNLPRESQSIRVDLRKGLSQLLRMPKFTLFLLTTFLVFGPIYANNFYFGIFITDIGGTFTGVGIAFLLAAGSEAPFMKIAEKWIGKLGLMKILLLAALVSGVRWIFYSFEPSLFLVYATTIVQGFSVGLFIPAALQYVRDISPDSVKATAVSLYSAIGNGLGTWFCTFFGGVILERFHIMTVYMFFGILTIFGVIVLFIIQLLERKTAA